jgi:hypothetical protein
MLRNGKTYLHKCGTHAGCSCCNTKAVRQRQTGSLRQRERRAWKTNERSHQ